LRASWFCGRLPFGPISVCQPPTLATVRHRIRHAEAPSRAWRQAADASGIRCSQRRGCPTGGALRRRSRRDAVEDQRLLFGTILRRGGFNSTRQLREQLMGITRYIAAAAFSLVVGGAMAGPANALPVDRLNSPAIPGIAEPVQFFFGGRQYCWYNRGWHGPGFYWCGYAFRRGFGWGGPAGWRGWRHVGPPPHVRGPRRGPPPRAHRPLPAQRGMRAAPPPRGSAMPRGGGGGPRSGGPGGGSRGPR